MMGYCHHTEQNLTFTSPTNKPGNMRNLGKKATNKAIKKFLFFPEL